MKLSKNFPRNNSGAYPIAFPIRRLNFLLSIVLISWIYVGFFRIYIARSIANYLYFLPYALLLLTFIFCLLYLRSNISHSGIFIILNISFLTFQAFHVLYSNISITTAIFGFCLYALPLNLLSITKILGMGLIVKRFMKLTLTAATPNLLMTILQTFSSNSKFARGILNEGNATTSDGFSRAYGTFTAPAGFAIYLSLLTACIIISAPSKPKFYRQFMYFQLTMLYILSGSRTVFFSLGIILIAIAIAYGRENLFKGFSKVSKYSLIILLLYLIFSRINLGAFDALMKRFATASTQENTSGRIFENIFGFLEQIYQPFFGSGLGSYAIGNVGYSNTSQWIELDLVRNIFEMGSIIGVIWIFFRFWLFFYLPVRFIRNGDRNSILLFGSIAPYLLFGPISGQSSISIGCWLGVVMSIALSKSISVNNNESTA